MFLPPRHIQIDSLVHVVLADHVQAPMFRSNPDGAGAADTDVKRAITTTACRLLIS
jgi:hypothetical protein